jgi:hypothetical protein
VNNTIKATQACSKSEWELAVLLAKSLEAVILRIEGMKIVCLEWKTIKVL